MAIASKIASPEEAVVEVRTGVVEGNQNWSRSDINVRTTTTHDAATGHGRSDLDVSTTSTEELRLFVRDDAGQEFEIRAHGVGFGFREGQRVSAIYLASAGDSQRSDRDNLVGLINHSTSKHTLFDSSVRKRISGPVGLLGMVVGLAMVIAGPILVYKLWSAFGPGDEDFGWIFIKGLGSLVIGVFGALFLHSRLSAMFSPKGPTIEEAVFERLREARDASMEQEKSRMVSTSE
ncbi:hypothetical protein EAO27_18285 [Sphingopyxis sp. YF1]|uniref:hypothetical protein n=1 Tax=Sphingopyxis sp. YF1 TaxID=2482763 RepID=UPI001F603CD5|nr:hypothetical protein [Sphingopyxis sp. YF1]UNU44438.1 hypothetical protein EAO27_18285 [Sphingopyxis sp. YF1]